MGGGGCAYLNLPSLSAMTVLLKNSFTFFTFYYLEQNKRSKCKFNLFHQKW